MPAVIACDGPARADPLIWALSQDGAQSYVMRMGAQLPVARLPAAWETSFGTDIGFAAARRGRSPAMDRPAGRRASRPPAGGMPVPSCQLWGAFGLPQGLQMLGLDDARLGLRLSPVERRGRLSMATVRRWSFRNSLTATLRDSYRLFLGGGDPAAPRWRANAGLQLAYAATGTAVRLDAGRTDRRRGVRRSLVAEQRLSRGLRLAASVESQPAEGASHGLRAIYEPGDRFRFSASFRSGPGPRPERSLQLRLKHSW